jgi:hypothetical protein
MGQGLLSPAPYPTSLRIKKTNFLYQSLEKYKIGQKFAADSNNLTVSEISRRKA